MKPPLVDAVAEARPWLWHYRAVRPRKRWVPVADLCATQRYVSESRVQHYVRRRGLPAIQVFNTEIGLLIFDGHHRATAAKLKGRVQVLANVYEMEPA